MVSESFQVYSSEYLLDLSDHSLSDRLYRLEPFIVYTGWLSLKIHFFNLWIFLYLVLCNIIVICMEKERFKWGSEKAKE